MIAKQTDEQGRIVTFTMRNADGSNSMTRYYEDLEPWSDILADFIMFLEGSGFIDVKSRVSIEDSPFVDDRWDGPRHDPVDQEWK